MAVVEASELHKRYGSVHAVRGIDLSIDAGTCFGLLGHNGAGKTTTMKVLTGRTRPTSGTAQVLGADVVTEREAYRPRINVVGDRQNLHPRLTVRRTMQFWGSLYGVERARGDALLERVGLDPGNPTLARDLSTGMRQRLIIARALINDPALLFLDEPTRGLDPASARTLRAIVRDIVANGTTVFLTTHDMTEAEDLCDDIAIIDAGNLVAQGTPARLRTVHGGDEPPGVTVELRDGTIRRYDLARTADRAALAAVLETGDIASMHSDEPSLTDVFISLVGQPPDTSDVPRTAEGAA